MKRFQYYLALVLLSFSPALLFGEKTGENSFNKENISIEFPEIIVAGVEQEIVIRILAEDLVAEIENTDITIKINEKKYSGRIVHGITSVHYDFPEDEELTISVGEYEIVKDVTPIPLWLSIIPPLIAILFALVLREVYSALLSGIWIGSGIIYF